MKTNLIKKAVFAAGLVAGSIVSSFAQQPAPGQNYWIVESNVHDPNFSIVKFYTPQHELIYEEKLNRYLDINRRKNVKVLNRTLQQLAEKTLVAGQFSGSQTSPSIALVKKRSENE